MGQISEVFAGSRSFARPKAGDSGRSAPHQVKADPEFAPIRVWITIASASPPCTSSTFARICEKGREVAHAGAQPQDGTAFADMYAMVVPLRDWLLLRGRMRRVALLPELPLLSVGAELALLGLLANAEAVAS